MIVKQLSAMMRSLGRPRRGQMEVSQSAVVHRFFLIKASCTLSIDFEFCRVLKSLTRRRITTVQAKSPIEI